MPNRLCTTAIALLAASALSTPRAQESNAAAIVLEPERVFDGETMHAGWIVVVRGDRVESVGPAASVTRPPAARAIPLTGTTLLPGLIEGHSHLLLHPYNETTWNDQVAREPLAYRVARAVN